MQRIILTTILLAILSGRAFGQSADWQQTVWREPQVRYLLADMTGGGKTELYRKYAIEERDPDSREAIRRWDAGVRVVNMSDFERRWVTNKLSKTGRAFRVVFRGTSRTITGTEVIQSDDGKYSQLTLRLALLDLTLGTPTSSFAQRANEPAIAEALRVWNAGGRAINAHLFEAQGAGKSRQLLMRGSGCPTDGTLVKLNTDLPYPETNVRYFMADIALGGSLEFYRQTAEEAHEMGCLEAVRRTEEGYTVVNLAQFERKKVNGKTLITRQGSDLRISGLEVKLSSD